MIDKVNWDAFAVAFVPGAGRIQGTLSECVLRVLSLPPARGNGTRLVLERHPGDGEFILDYHSVERLVGLQSHELGGVRGREPSREASRPMPAMRQPAQR
jgi:hypothetical protein